MGFAIVTPMWLQYRLAIKGFFLRGGFTFGLCFADNNIIFGPALVSAVALERATAMPRIQLDDGTLAIVDQHFYYHGNLADNPFHHELMRDCNDDVVFISYLAASQEPDEPEEQYAMLQWHRDAIARQLDMGHPWAVRAKYEWLARYHNAYCCTFARNWPDLQIESVAGGEDQFIPYVP